MLLDVKFQKRMTPRTTTNNNGMETFFLKEILIRIHASFYGDPDQFMNRLIPGILCLSSLISFNSTLSLAFGSEKPSFEREPTKKCFVASEEVVMGLDIMGPCWNVQFTTREPFR